MKWIVTLGVFGAVLAGCVDQPNTLGEGRSSGISSDIAIRPKARPEVKPSSALGAPPPENARTIEALDTTSESERDAALEVPSSTGERALGKTIASLGSPTEPGFWLKTPLVTSETQGRVFYTETGKSVQVTLIPIDGPETAGSRISLAALRLLEAPLAGLPEVDVFSDT